MVGATIEIFVFVFFSLDSFKREKESKKEKKEGEL
jgi:hypothetical protein